MMSAFDFLFHWYQECCDGEWEHQYGIRINTTDNPGWQIQIDLAETEIEYLNIDYQLTENGDHDWFGYSVKDKLFSAVGDPQKLELLLSIFMDLVEGKQNGADVVHPNEATNSHTNRDPI